MADAPEVNQSKVVNSASKGEVASGSRRVALKNRAFSTVCILGILFFAFWFSQQWLYGVLFGLLSIGSLVEYFKLFPVPGFRRYCWQACGVAAAYIALLFIPISVAAAPWLVELEGLAVALLLTLIVLERMRYPLEGVRTLGEIAATVFGFIYCVLLFSFVPKILLLDLKDVSGGAASPYYVIFLLVVTKSSDAGAYLVGSMIGKHKMIPHVSPGKTWQGFGGALVFATIASLTLYFLIGDRIPIITLSHAVVMAILLALAAVVGDLAESILKRSLEAKDSGKVMPGIGGFLDLVDSVIFTAPLFYLYLMIFR